MFLFVDGDACMEQESNWKENLHTRSSRRESGLLAGIDFSQNSRPYIVLKLLRDLQAMIVFQWSGLIRT